MKTVWKYELTNPDGVTLHVPYNGNMSFPQQVLHCDTQNDTTACLWALVDTEQDTRPIRVVTHGTGHDATLAAVNLTHIGSVLLYSKRIVIHVFAESGKPQRM